VSVNERLSCGSGEIRSHSRFREGDSDITEESSAEDQLAPRVFSDPIETIDKGGDLHGRRMHDADMRAGGLRAKFDAIILPDQASAALRRGLAAPYPDSLRGGLGDKGADALKAFVNEGGTLLAFNEASEYAIETFTLPVRNVLADVKNTDFYAPGSILGVEVNRGHPLAGSFSAAVPAVWFEDSPTFAVTDASKASVVLRYRSAGDPLLSGWLLGGARLNGQAAMVDVAVGSGHVVLYGFRPQYRAQTNATWPLIWSAILR